MWKLDELETEISDKRFWAWRHCTGSMSVGYRVRLRGAYSNRRFRVYIEKSEMRPYGPPAVHIVFDNAELMTGAEMLKKQGDQKMAELSQCPASGLSFGGFRPLLEYFSRKRYGRRTECTRTRIDVWRDRY